MSRPNSMRYRGYDYTAPSAYFVTICACRGRSVFGQVSDGVMQLNPLGQIADACWRSIARQHAGVIEFLAVCIMPNHAHLLLLFRLLGLSAPSGDLVDRRFAQPMAGSLSALIGAYKATVTARARRQGLLPPGPLWQRNFWDRIVRDEQELETVRHYIETNPARWVEDQLHPQAAPNAFNRAWKE